MKEKQEDLYSIDQNLKPSRIAVKKQKRDNGKRWEAEGLRIRNPYKRDNHFGDWDLDFE